MKKVTIAVLAIAAASFSMGAHAANITGTNDSIETQLCVAAASGNNAKFHRAVRQSQQSIRFIGKSVACNGINIKDFAAMHGADVISAKLARYQDKTDFLTATAKR
ncbi:hypothetical protein PULV_a2345 [Pseudoalteromonas ulvae UL12]|nr:DUF3718 domain-containing protein [Pseudoalteromonas ulvae]MBE0364616.1 hypothetical protein [Pseudoalteromonas ulvae UL12]